MKKLAVFVDVQNVYYTVRQTYRRNFDYNKFWSEVSQLGEVVTAYAYAIDRGDRKQEEFQNILRAIGFQVKLKPYIQRSDGSAKGDWDVGITLDVMDVADDVDIVILVSGDGDFDLLVNKVRTQKSKVVKVYGVPQLTASSLINSATDYIPINEQLLMS